MKKNIFWYYRLYMYILNYIFILLKYEFLKHDTESIYSFVYNLHFLIMGWESGLEPGTRQLYKSNALSWSHMPSSIIVIIDCNILRITLIKSRVEFVSCSADG